MMIQELRYSNTNTWLIEGAKGKLLFDTGWAGTFSSFCNSIGDLNIPLQAIDYILISHYHPDHMGIAQEIASLGPVILVTDVQKDFIHVSDKIFEKEGNRYFRPVEDDKVRFLDISDSRAFLGELGIDGMILHTPGHSDDSISLCLDDGSIFVGDLNPLYELDLHRGSQIGESWNRLLALNPKKVYYGHAGSFVIPSGFVADPVGSVIDPSGSLADRKDSFVHDGKKTSSTHKGDRYDLVMRIMKYVDKGLSSEKIQKKTGAEAAFIEDVTRMYLTHQNIGVQGILDRIDR